MKHGMSAWTAVALLGVYWLFPLCAWAEEKTPAESATVIATQPEVITVGPRGVVLVDGQPTIPWAVWHQPPDRFRMYQKLGVRWVFPPGGTVKYGKLKPEVVCDFAQRSGIRLIPSDDPALRGQSAVAAWMVGLIRPDQIDKMVANAQRIRAADGKRFLIANIDAHDLLKNPDPAMYRRGLHRVDAVISHVWPEMLDPSNPDLRLIGLLVDRVREYDRGREGGEVSIWVDLNVRAWKLKDDLGGQAYRAPTREELRYQIWLALIRGADGICLFPISFDPFQWGDIPIENQTEIQWNTQLTGRLASVLAAESSPQKIGITSEKLGGRLDFTTREHKGRHYIIAVNGDSQEQTICIAMEGLGSTWSLRDVIADQTRSAGDGKYSEPVSGLGLRIWELNSVEVPKTP